MSKRSIVCLCFNAWFLMIPTVRVGYFAFAGEEGECGDVPDILNDNFEIVFGMKVVS